MAGSEKKIDASAMGYDKVLGTGEVKAKLQVKACCFSASAKRKIEEAGEGLLRHDEKLRSVHGSLKRALFCYTCKFR